MRGQQISRRRTLAGLGLAIIAAPVATALSIEVVLLLSPAPSMISLSDRIGGSLTFLLFALVFGSVLAAVPGLILGGLAVAIARMVGTRSPVFYAAAGLIVGTLMALIDTGRSHSAFAMSEGVPFIIGGCVSALTYWAVAER